MAVGIENEKGHASGCGTAKGLGLGFGIEGLGELMQFQQLRGVIGIWEFLCLGILDLGSALLKTFPILLRSIFKGSIGLRKDI